MKIEYRKVGDYYLPNLIAPKSNINISKIGKYGRLRLNYLKEHRKGEYTLLLVNNKLKEHLIEIDKSANEKLELLMHSNDIDYLNLFDVLNKNEDYLTKGNNIYITNEGNIAIFNKLYRKIDQLYLHKQL
mgnify:CR=1 FL=1